MENKTSINYMNYIYIYIYIWKRASKNKCRYSKVIEVVECKNKTETISSKKN